MNRAARRKQAHHERRGTMPNQTPEPPQIRQAKINIVGENIDPKIFRESVMQLYMAGRVPPAAAFAALTCGFVLSRETEASLSAEQKATWDAATQLAKQNEGQLDAAIVRLWNEGAK